MAKATGRHTLYGTTPLRLARTTAEADYADFDVDDSGNVTVTPTGDGLGVPAGKSFRYDGDPTIRGQKALANFYAGQNAGNLTTTGAALTAVGFRALANNTTGNYNTAIGKDALFTNTTGSGNTAIGETSMLSNTTGGANTALGEASLYNNTTGNSNAAIGRSTLTQNTTGNENVALGYLALFNATTADKNVAVGFQSLYTSASGNGRNVAVGSDTLYNLTSGQFNVAIGSGTGSGITTGSGNTIVGANVTGLAAGLANNIILASGTGGTTRAQFGGTSWNFPYAVQLTDASNNSSVRQDRALIWTSDGLNTGTIRSGLYGTASGTLVFGTGASLTTALTIDANQNTVLAADLIIDNSSTPASASATGTAGTIAWDSSYIYVCTATDTWKRVAIATW